MRTASVNSSAVVGAPINLSATVSGQTVFLSWSAPATRRPRVQLRDTGRQRAGISNLANVAIPALTSLTRPRVPFGVYYVRVRAADAAGPGAPSNEVVVTVGGCAGPPQSVVVASQSAGTISLAWSPPASGSPTSYMIIAGSAAGLSNVITLRYPQPEPVDGCALGPCRVLLRACALAQQLRDECRVKRGARVCGGLERRRSGQRVVGRSE